ncbi:harpin-induced 1 [Trifolium pratense]|uniref:Harpin-induced 1 n=1 Tax=Trifolium pratense TaxID=57577 RepID=A0A2K3MLJ7_TRIPR|nr:harpin-induced 1 [Trifolium pratense]
MTTAISSYKKQEFGWATVDPFVLGNMNTISLEPVKFEGHSVIKLEPEQVVEYKTETRLGFYNLSLELETTSPSLHCSDLIVPLISKGEIAPPFNVTQCL